VGRAGEGVNENAEYQVLSKEGDETEAGMWSQNSSDSGCAVGAQCIASLQKPSTIGRVQVLLKPKPCQSVLATGNLKLATITYRLLTIDYKEQHDVCA
jgi:hypothetical protein